MEYIKKYSPIEDDNVNLLLLGHTDGTSSTASCLGMLTTDTETPVMTHTTMGTDFL